MVQKTSKGNFGSIFRKFWRVAIAYSSFDLESGVSLRKWFGCFQAGRYVHTQSRLGVILAEAWVGELLKRKRWMALNMSLPDPFVPRLVWPSDPLMGT